MIENLLLKASRSTLRFFKISQEKKWVLGQFQILDQFDFLFMKEDQGCTSLISKDFKPCCTDNFFHGEEGKRREVSTNSPSLTKTSMEEASKKIRSLFAVQDMGAECAAAKSG